MRRYDRHKISSFSQEQSARQTRNSSARGIQLVMCSYRQKIIVRSAKNSPKHDDVLFLLISHDQQIVGPFARL
jgi:hypothetical protein